MDAVKFLKERNRMCDSYGSSSCLACQINEARGAMRCYDFQKKYPEQTVDIVKEWSAKHTKETRLTRLLKNYPNTPLLNKDGIPVYVCAAHLGLMDIEDCDNDCIICWNRPIEEE